MYTAHLEPWNLGTLTVPKWPVGAPSLSRCPDGLCSSSTRSLPFRPTTFPNYTPFHQNSSGHFLHGTHGNHHHYVHFQIILFFFFFGKEPFPDT